MRFIRTPPFSVNRQRVQVRRPLEPHFCDRTHVFVDIRFRDHHSAEREVYILERGWNSIECRVLAPTIQHKRCRVNCECYCEESFVSPFLSAIITKLVNQIARMIFKLSNRSLFSYNTYFGAFFIVSASRAVSGPSYLVDLILAAI